MKMFKRNKITFAWLLLAAILAVCLLRLPIDPVHIYGLQRMSAIANPFEPPLFGQAGTKAQSVSARGTPMLIQISNPAAGADWTWSIPGPQAYLFHFSYAVFQTSATVATREVRLAAQFTSGAVTVGIWPAQATETAGNTVAYSSSHAASSGADPSTNFILLPYDVWITPGMQVVSSTLNIQTTDQWSSVNIYAEQFPSANY